jgi:hypothetical protein
MSEPLSNKIFVPVGGGDDSLCNKAILTIFTISYNT